MEALKRCYDRLHGFWTSSKRTHDFRLCPLKVVLFSSSCVYIMEREMAEVVPDLRVASVRLQYCDITKVKGSVLGRLETWLETRGYCWSGFLHFMEALQN